MRVEDLERIAKEEGFNFSEGKAEAHFSHSSSLQNDSCIGNIDSVVVRHGSRNKDKRDKTMSKETTEKKARVETEVRPTEIYAKSAVSGKSLVFGIKPEDVPPDGLRITISNSQLMAYLEGGIDFIRLFKVVPKTDVNNIAPA